VAPVAAGLDVGGTKVAGLLLDDGGRVLEEHSLPTMAEDAEGAATALVDLARELIGMEEDVVALGAGVAGLIDSRTGVCRFAPNLPWREFPVLDRLAEAVDVPVVVDNDANAAAWGEFRYGAGVGYREVLVATVGTGIGGAIISEGRLVRGAQGFAGEIGHVIVEPDGPRCGCGNLGCLEQVASGNAIGRLGRQAALDQPGSLIATLAGSAEEVRGNHVEEAARSGDPIAVHIFEEVGRRLGQGLAGLANVLDPEVVVVGGGVVEAGELLLGPAREAFLDALEAPAFRAEIPILPAVLGNHAGAIGAATLALEALAG
jgi:glucokinase